MFAHLHVHTQYSLLDGFAKIDKVVKKAKEMGMTSLAITDHGVMFGVIDYYKECKKQGIHPVIGCEVYVAHESRFSKSKETDRHQNHLVLLAKNQTGYNNLMKLVSLGYTEGFYYKPRIDKEIMKKYSEGLICLSACLAGSVQQKLLNGDYEGAKKEALEHLAIYGEGNYYLEIQDQGLPEEAKIRPLLIKLHNETGIPLVATNDVHYVNKEDAEAHDVLLCIQTGNKLNDTKRLRYPNNEFYLKSEEEMRELFKTIPEAIENTSKIAERCNVDFEFGHLHLPKFPVPDGKTNIEYLKELCFKGLHELYDEITPEIKDRLEMELNVIIQMGFVDYFLIVWDYVNFARENGIMVGPGRGSAAGSIVAYTLRITDVDPIKYNLIFERFLNPERISMPDIDIDFLDDRRSEVIDYVIRKYGADRVAQIITFITMKARAAVRDVGRVLDVSYAETDVIAKAIPNENDITINAALEKNPKLKEMYETDIQTKKVIDMAKAIEGMPRNASTHAAGVVISKKDVGEYVPLYSDGKIIETQFEKNTLEELGLLKMDFLGLRNIGIIKDALDLIKERHNVEIDFKKMDYDDPEVFELISSGNTQGVFQLESAGMISFMKELKPDCFEDIIAGISLYRPGPIDSIPTYLANKRNPENIKYLHESLKPILDTTYGCMVYQEQIMEIVRSLAGYSYGRSDKLRKMMAKKKMKEMIAEREIFLNGKLDENGNIEIPGCVRNGISADIGNKIFDQMVSFAEYAFNKSHAAAYAIISYETAYLKKYYTIEYMTALLSSVMGKAAQTVQYIRNCNEMGFEVLPPDVNYSVRKYSIRNNKILFGMGGIKNVGNGAIEAIISARENSIPDTLSGFINNLEISKVNKKAIESLIKSGATSCLKGNTAQHMAVYEKILESAQKNKKTNIEGQVSLFGQPELMQTSSNLPKINDFDTEIKGKMEKEMLGIYLTSNPLDNYTENIKKYSTVNNIQLAQYEEENIRDGQIVTIGGILTEIKQKVTKNNQMMAFVTLEDLYAPIELIVFPKTYADYSHTLFEDNIVLVKGKVNIREEETPKIIVSEILSLEKDIKQKVKLRVDFNTVSQKQVEDLLKRHPGNVPVIIFQQNKKPVQVPQSMFVYPGSAFTDNAKQLLGSTNVKV